MHGHVLGKQRTGRPTCKIGIVTHCRVKRVQRASHRQHSESILEALLKPEELDDAQIHGGVEPEPALVRTQCA